MMRWDDTIREMQALGLHAETLLTEAASADSGADSCATSGTDSAIGAVIRIGLRLDSHATIISAAVPDEALEQASSWLDAIIQEADRTGQRLRDRRHAIGYTTSHAFCEATGLDESAVFEAEAGMTPASNVHERILGWMESGCLHLTK